MRLKRVQYTKAMNHCKIENCTNTILAKGYCSTHYKKYVYSVEHPLYHTWQSMIARCHREWSQNYRNYGQRGIKVCKRWQTFANFERDMSPKPPGTSLERVNNNRGYSPANCKWATAKEQRANTRTQRKRIDSTHPYRGLRQLQNGRWVVRGTNGKHLGTFNTLQEAIKHRDNRRIVKKVLQSANKRATLKGQL